MSAHPTQISQPLASQELRALFADHGLRATRQREAVYQELRATTSHPTADELMAMVRVSDPEISQATIYNTLDALVGCGLARRIPSANSGGACMYDANIGEHVHLVLDDGRVMDVPMDLSKAILDAVPERVLKELADRIGVKLSGINIELMGHTSPEPLPE
jgi:Fur family transcriptional regulator, peroxide stress response regulator